MGDVLMRIWRRHGYGLGQRLQLASAARLHLGGAARQPVEEPGQLLLHLRLGAQAGVRRHLLARPVCWLLSSFSPFLLPYSTRGAEKRPGRGTCHPRLPPRSTPRGRPAHPRSAPRRRATAPRTTATPPARSSAARRSRAGPWCPCAAP